MNIHIQKCQQCNSRNLRNILVREDANRVFVQCRECGSFVARYVIAPSGYYHDGKDFEGYLRTVSLESGFSSGRDLKAAYIETAKNSRKGFTETLEKAHEKYGEDLP